MAPVGWYESKGSKMSLPCCPNIIRQDVWPWPDVIGVPLETTLWNSLERTSRFPKTLSNQKKISSQSCWEGGCIPKLLLYKGAICPQVIFNLPTTWRSGEISKLSGSKDEWKPKSTSNLTTPYRKMHVSHVCKLITLQDPVAQHVAKLQIEKENRTNREASSSQRLQYRKIMMAGIPRWEELRKQWNHSQGELQSADGKECCHLVVRDHAKASSRSPQICFEAPQDTLPHNANLAIWRWSEGSSSHCKLCGER